VDAVDCNGGFCDGCMSLEDMVERTFDSLLSLSLQCRLFLYRFLASRFSLPFQQDFKLAAIMVFPVPISVLLHCTTVFHSRN